MQQQELPALFSETVNPVLLDGSSADQQTLFALDEATTHNLKANRARECKFGPVFTMHDRNMWPLQVSHHNQVLVGVQQSHNRRRVVFYYQKRDYPKSYDADNPTMSTASLFGALVQPLLQDPQRRLSVMEFLIDKHRLRGWPTDRLVKSYEDQKTAIANAAQLKRATQLLAPHSSSE